MTFGERLIKLRTERGYPNRTQFAKILGIPSTTLRNYEKDEREAGHKFLIQISNFFDVTVDYLLGVTDEENNYTENRSTPTSNDNEIVSLDNLLDTEDKAEIRGVIKGMLRAEKYSASKSKLHA